MLPIPFIKAPFRAGGSGPLGAIRVTNLDYTSNNAVIFSTSPDIVSATELSITYWVRINDIGGLSTVTPFLVSNNTSGTEWHMHTLEFTVPESYFDITLANTGVVSDIESTSGVDTSAWVFVCCVKTATHVITYMNGAALGTGIADSDAVETNPGSFLSLFYFPDQTPATSPVDIELGQLRVYNKGLSPAEVADLYAQVDVIDGLIHKIEFAGTCNDSVGTMTSTVGANITYVEGPPVTI